MDSIGGVVHMTVSLIMLIVGLLVFKLLQWGAHRSAAQDEFEDRRAKFMVKLCLDYDYPQGCFRGQFRPDVAEFVEMQKCR